MRCYRQRQPSWVWVGKDAALITDGRFSGGTHGFVVGHITPEAYDGGVIALIEDGDEITINAETQEVNVKVSDGELAARKGQWRAPELRYTRVF